MVTERGCAEDACGQLRLARNSAQTEACGDSLRSAPAASLHLLGIPSDRLCSQEGFLSYAHDYGICRLDEFFEGVHRLDDRLDIATLNAGTTVAVHLESV